MKEHESGMSSALQTIVTSSPRAPKTGLEAVTSKPTEVPRAALRTARAKGKAAAAAILIVVTRLLRNFNYINM